MRDEENGLLDVLAETVSAVGGCKQTELIANVAVINYINRHDITPYRFEELLEMAIQKGDIVEIEYIRPDMPERIKSFLLPKGSTVVSVQGQRRP